MAGVHGRRHAAFGDDGLRVDQREVEFLAVPHVRESDDPAQDRRFAAPGAAGDDAASAVAVPLGQPSDQFGQDGDASAEVQPLFGLELHSARPGAEVLREVAFRHPALDFEVRADGRKFLPVAGVAQEGGESGDQPAGQFGALAPAVGVEAFVDGLHQLGEVEELLALSRAPGRRLHGLRQGRHERPVFGYVLAAGGGQEPQSRGRVTGYVPVRDGLQRDR